MNILVIAQQLPYPPNTGGKIRHYCLYSRLAQRHQITWLAPTGPDDYDNINMTLRFCDRVVSLPLSQSIRLPDRGWKNVVLRVIAHVHWERLFEYCFGYVNASGLCWVQGTSTARRIVQEVVGSATWDAIICESIGSVELTPLDSKTPRLVSLFDIQSELFRRIRHITPLTWEDRLFFIPELLKIRAYEKHYYSQFNAAITVSEHDRVLLAKLCPKLKSGVVDNGVDTAYYHAGPAVQEVEGANSLAFVGSYGYPPNLDAVQYFTRDILPRIRKDVEDATFFIVGRDAPSELCAIPGVRVIGTVPDVRPYLQRASVVVVPLRVGSGTRIKILEAMAAAKPVVTTSVGVEGLKAKHGQHLMVADRPDDFADSVVQLLRDASLRRNLGLAGRKLVEQEYDWDILVQRFESFIANVVQSKEG